MTEQTKAKLLTEAHIIYLNDLRESGAVNMFGAGEYIERAFGVTRREARTILSEWMTQF